MHIENPLAKMPTEEEKVKDIKGDNFVIKQSLNKSSGISNGIQLEFRPGESTEEKIKERKKVEQKEVERTKDFAPADWAKEFFEDMLKYKNIYSETFEIKSDGSLDKIGHLSCVYTHMEDINTPEEFYQFAQDVQKKYPEYQFNFETDPERKWFKYTVSKIESEKKNV